MASRQPVFDFAGLATSIQEADTARTIPPPASGALTVQESADSVRTMPRADPAVPRCSDTRGERCLNGLNCYFLGNRDLGCQNGKNKMT